MFTLGQCNTVRKILPWPRHYQSTSSTVPCKENRNKMGSFASDKKSPKLCHHECSSWVLISPQALTLRILTGKQQTSHPKVWDHQKKLTKKQQKHNKFIWWVNGGNTEHWHRWEKNHIAKFKTKQQRKTQLQIRKTIIFLDRKYMVKSSHQEWIVTKPVKEKGIQNNYHLTWW